MLKQLKILLSIRVGDAGTTGEDLSAHNKKERTKQMLYNNTVLLHLKCGLQSWFPTLPAKTYHLCSVNN